MRKLTDEYLKDIYLLIMRRLTDESLKYIYLSGIINIRNVIQSINYKHISSENISKLLRRHSDNYREQFIKTKKHLFSRDLIKKLCKTYLEVYIIKYVNLPISLVKKLPSGYLCELSETQLSFKNWKKLTNNKNIDTVASKSLTDDEIIELNRHLSYNYLLSNDRSVYIVKKALDQAFRYGIRMEDIVKINRKYYYYYDYTVKEINKLFRKGIPGKVNHFDVNRFDVNRFDVNRFNVNRFTSNLFNQIDCMKQIINLIYYSILMCNMAHFTVGGITYILKS